jgi:protein arginine kinase activator
MYCQICKKKIATVHFTEISENKKVEIHICRDCAEDKGFLLDIGSYPLGLKYGPEADKGKEKEPAVQPRCSLCGMKYSDFRKSGKLGCGNCYEVFGEKLERIIKKIHGNSVHLGKTPDLSGEAQKRRLLERRRRKLKELVSQERFEEASRLRDIIKSME